MSDISIDRFTHNNPLVTLQVLCNIPVFCIYFPGTLHCTCILLVVCIYFVLSLKYCQCTLQIPFHMQVLFTVFHILQILSKYSKQYFASTSTLHYGLYIVPHMQCPRTIPYTFNPAGTPPLRPGGGLARGENAIHSLTNTVMAVIAESRSTIKWLPERHLECHLNQQHHPHHVNHVPS